MIVLLNILLWLVAVGFGILALMSLVNDLSQKNIFSTIVEEGTAKAITFFGHFHRAVMEFKDHYLDEEWNVVPISRLSSEPNPPRPAPKKKLFGGPYIVGLWPFYKVHQYKFQWATLRLASGEDVSEGPPEKILQRDREMDYIFVKKDVYIIQLRSAEDKDMVPLDVVVALTASCCNIHKALFKVHNWMNIVIQSFEPVMRQLVAERKYEDIVKEKEMLGKNFCKELGLQKGQAPDPDSIIGRIKNEFGIEISNVGLKDINPAAEKRDEIIGWATQKYQAERKKEATVVNAEAERQRKMLEAEGEAAAKMTIADAEAYAQETVAKGRAKAIETVATAMGGKRKQGANVVVLDTLEKMGGKTVVLGADSLMETVEKLAKGQAKGGENKQ